MQISTGIYSLTQMIDQEQNNILITIFFDIKITLLNTNKHRLTFPLSLRDPFSIFSFLVQTTLRK